MFIRRERHNPCPVPSFHCLSLHRVLSAHSLVCLNLNLSSLNISLPSSIPFSLQCLFSLQLTPRFTSSLQSKPSTLPTTSRLTLSLHSSLPAIPPLHCAANSTCDRCGVCANVTSPSNQCVGEDGTVYGRSEVDCPEGQIWALGGTHG